jgi:hypothetical protein
MSMDPRYSVPEAAVCGHGPCPSRNEDTHCVFPTRAEKSLAMAGPGLESYTKVDVNDISEGNRVTSEAM